MVSFSEYWICISLPLTLFRFPRKKKFWGRLFEAYEVNSQPVQSSSTTTPKLFIKSKIFASTSLADGESELNTYILLSNTCWWSNWCVQMVEYQQNISHFAQDGFRFSCNSVDIKFSGRKILFIRADSYSTSKETTQKLYVQSTAWNFGSSLDAERLSRIWIKLLEFVYLKTENKVLRIYFLCTICAQIFGKLTVFKMFLFSSIFAPKTSLSKLRLAESLV